MADKTKAAPHKKDAGATAAKRKAMKALVKKLGAEEGTGHLKGGKRAEAKQALNWLKNNPAPAAKKKKKEG